jgi:Ca2+-binding RTX toxin-like protein
MSTLTLLRIGMMTLVALAFGHVIFATAAANRIPPSHLDSISRSVGIDKLAPASCAAHPPSHLVSGSGTMTGTSGDDLILGSPSADTINGGGGNDCILGGGGDDTLVGGPGVDVCIGGPGADSIDVSCEDQLP